MTTTANARLDAALGYERSGMSVIAACWTDDAGRCMADGPSHGARCNNPGKTPLVKWKQYQTTRPAAADLRYWWRTWPLANPVIVTGAVSGRVVIDPDGPIGAEAWAEIERRLEPPATQRVKTPRGEHLHFAYPGDGIEVPNSVGELAPHVDVRGDGGIAVMPGARNSRGEYVWEALGHPDDVKLAPMPPALLAMVLAAGRRASTYDPNRARFDTAAALSGAPEGERDDMVWRLAAKLRYADVPEDMAERLVTEAAAKCDPPFPEDVALEKVARVYRTYEPGRTPRTAVATSQAQRNGHRLDAGEVVTTPSEPALQTAPVPFMTLSEVQAVYRKWLHVPDTGALEVTLGAYAANLQHGDPVWLLLVDVAGGGKTEAINSTSKLKHVRPVAVLTEAALLSGTPKKEAAKSAKGGLLRELGEFGILTLKDFGSVLSMNRDSRGPILAALREVYDGSWTRYVGTDGGRELHWQGKAGMIAGATPAIDGHHAVMASLGERFLFYRPERGQEEENERTIRAAHSVGHEQEMREEIATAVAGLFAGLAIPEERTPLTEAETRKIVALAAFVARGRAAVERDTYSHSKEIVLVPGAESPTRLVKQLAMLLSGLLAIGVAYERAWMLVVKVGMDSMPQMRHKVFHALLNSPGEMATRAVSEATKVLTGSARRVLEELAVYDLAERNAEEKADLWMLSTWARDAYAAATAPLAAPGDALPATDTVPQIREAMYSAEREAEGAEQGGSLSLITTQPHDSTNLGNGVERAAAEGDPTGCPVEATASHEFPLAEATAGGDGAWGVI